MVYVCHFALNFLMPKDYHKDNKKELRKKLINLF